MKPAIDAADKRILSVLQDNGALSINQVAERVHMSSNACWRRIKRLEDEGYIVRRVAVLDPGQLGLGIIAHVSLRLAEQSSETLNRFVETASKIDQIVEISTMSGDMCFFLKAYSTDIAAHERMIAKLLETNQFSFIRSEFVLRANYSTNCLPLD